MLPRIMGGLLLLWLGSLAGLGQAQPSEGDEAEVTAGAAPPPSLLGTHFGVARFEELLRAPEQSQRLQGIQRLAGLGTPAARRRLVSFVLERRDPLGAAEALTLARELAPQAAEEDVEIVLARLMAQQVAPAAGPAQAALLELARGTAALALAAARSESALRVLGSALRSGGPAAALAAEALLAYPPSHLDPLLAVPGEPSVELARLLGELGDQRAFHPLRAWVRGESAEVRAAAAVALTQLGHLETVPLARQWLGSGVPVLERAAFEISMWAQEPEAVEVLGKQMARTDSDGEIARVRALQFPSAELLPLALERLGAERGNALLWTLLGRSGGAAAARALEGGLRHRESVFAAAHALSRLPGPAGHAAVLHALEDGVALPLTLRVAAVRAWQRGERFEALHARRAELHAAQAPEQRAAAAWAASLEGGAAALVELGSGDPLRVEAVANNALLLDDAVLERAASWLRAARPGRHRTAFAFALLRPSGRRGVSSHLLEEIVLEGGAAAPLAVRVLASRSEPRFAALAESYLAHPDPLLRAHAARGLGESGRPSAAGLLARSFEFESDEVVRQAIVWALSSHRGRAVARTLELAARLDPSRRVRSAARLARGGVHLADPPPSSDTLWVELRSVTAEPGPAPTGRASSGSSALLHVAPGLALPVFADPSGVLVVAGASLNPLALRLQ